ncbi:hypothetical protein OS493_009493 [Desmophyllum pertusum]|uniref:Peroxidase n=1 Tax=Desmophyllum pertusum TaxID=174260 RepID=A0A9W9Z5H2_9CNID|nr:hypothetical protein OS493_009493 [Desmophyllum pertusum]
MAMTWGQYLDHDITLAAQQDISCDGTCNDLTRECFGISIPVDDPHFPKVGVSCIALKRDAPATSAGLATPREHTNVLSAFIDASQVYGVDKNDFGVLRGHC